MIQARFIAAFLVVFFPLFASAAVIPEPSTREEFESYWEKFTAALSDEVEDHVIPLPPAVAGYTEFPFTSRGNMDFDPEVSYTQESFAVVLPRLLDSDVRTTELPTPMREYVMQKQVFSDADILAGEVRVGNFKFHKVHGYWKWYYAYYDTSPTP